MERKAKLRGDLAEFLEKHTHHRKEKKKNCGWEAGGGGEKVKKGGLSLGVFLLAMALILCLLCLCSL